ncbi:MAG: N-acetylmuramic acid 6-phosphate etherase [Phycisphaerae bacterium]|nr:N-acetylmuramic acid 6-phosphate etherase [Phycisphaerae bacterium]
MTLPPDRSHIRTEHRHDASSEFDALSTLDQVRLMADDARAVELAVTAAAPALAAFIDALVERMKRGGRLVYCGAGTSGRLGVLDASECPPTFQSDPAQVLGIIAGGDTALRRSSERKEDDDTGIAPELEAMHFKANDTLVGIAAGGTTPYALGAIRLAKARGALTAMVTCAPGSAFASCDHVIELDTGPEVLTGSTRLKAGSATKLALNIISTVAFTRLGKVYGNLMVDLAATNDKLLDRAIRLLRTFDESLTREEALALLERANRNVKTAIVMRRRGVERDEAVRLLDVARGSLRGVIG